MTKLTTNSMSLISDGDRIQLHRMPITKFSDYIVYVDESGDHSLTKIDRDYPIFVLVFCVFNKKKYSQKTTSLLSDFKLKHFGHDAVILHEAEIRKKIGDFSNLNNQSVNQEFMDELTEIIEKDDFVLIYHVVDKQKLRDEGELIENPYHIALKKCIDGLEQYLKRQHQENSLTHIIVECRGKKEDMELRAEFEQTCLDNQKDGVAVSFDLRLEDKKQNLAGLQVADLVARPLGRNYLSPQQFNRAFEILKPKIFVWQ
jgi:hypothetical protein